MDERDLNRTKSADMTRTMAELSKKMIAPKEPGRVDSRRTSRPVEVKLLAIPGTGLSKSRKKWS